MLWGALKACISFLKACIYGGFLVSWDSGWKQRKTHPINETICNVHRTKAQSRSRLRNLLILIYNLKRLHIFHSVK